MTRNMTRRTTSTHFITILLRRDAFCGSPQNELSVSNSLAFFSLVRCTCTAWLCIVCDCSYMAGVGGEICCPGAIGCEIGVGRV